jgi:hypothetical protein
MDDKIDYQFLMGMFKMKISMKEIKEFFLESGIKITTEKTNYAGRSYKLSNDDFPLTRSQLERKYLDEKK